MALTLQGLSRAACAASPRVLGAVTPRTPKTPVTPFFSPVARGAACFSPMPDAVASFGDLSAFSTPFGDLSAFSTPKPVSTAAPSLFQQARASMVAQQDLAEEARPLAESAHQYFLSRRSQGLSAIALSGAYPTLLRCGAKSTPVADSLPTLLGSKEPPAAAPVSMAMESEQANPLHAAQEAHKAFMARQQQREGRGLRVGGDEVAPMLLGSSARAAPAARKGKTVKFEFDPVHAANEARDLFLAKRGRMESRGVEVTVP